MDDEWGATRIEIELTPGSDQGSGRRRKRRGADLPPPDSTAFGTLPIPDPPPDHAPGLLATERRRLAVTAVGVGVAAMLVGWAVGHGGGDPAPAAGDVPTTTAATQPTSVAPGVVTVRTIASDEFSDVDAEDEPQPEFTFPPEPVDDVATTVTPTGSSAAAGQGWGPDETFTMSDALPAIDVRVVAQTDDGEVVELDLATGGMRRAAGGDSTALLYAETVVAGADWALLPMPDHESAILIAADGTDSLISFENYSRMLHVPGSDSLTLVHEQDSSAFTVTSAHFDGAPGDEPEFEVPAGWFPVGLDPARGVVVINRGNAGGFYGVGPDGSQRLTAGMLLAVSPSVTLAYECGATLDSCSVVSVDRITFRSDPVTLPSDLGILQPLVSRSGGLVDGAMSPDGTHAVVQRSPDDSSTGLSVISLVDGTIVDLTDGYDGSTVAWSPDGRYFIYLEERQLMAYDAATGTQGELVPDADWSIQSFALRPAGG